MCYGIYFLWLIVWWCFNAQVMLQHTVHQLVIQWCHNSSRSQWRHRLVHTAVHRTTQRLLLVHHRRLLMAAVIWCLRIRCDAYAVSHIDLAVAAMSYDMRAMRWKLDVRLYSSCSCTRFYFMMISPLCALMLLSLCTLCSLSLADQES